MKQFFATRHHEGIEYGELLEAQDYSAAQRICRERGWGLQGEVVAPTKGLPYAPEDEPAIIAAIQDRQQSTVH